jgi:hypothetical protein
MLKHQVVAQLVQDAYQASTEDFAQWMWQYHVPVVARFTTELAQKYQAEADLAVAGAWLHDFGDAFMYRFAPEHAEVSRQKAETVLKAAAYSETDIKTVLEKVIAPHSCQNGVIPSTLEGQIMATGDALAHLTTDFYVQFAWKHLPDGKTYPQFLDWVAEKLDRDYHLKIFFPEVQQAVKHRYQALKEIFVPTGDQANFKL